MSKHEFVRAVAKEADCTIIEAEKVIDATFNTIVNQLAEGDDVVITKFGRFYTAKAAAREIKSPMKEEVILVPERIVPKFKFYDSVKNEITQ